jgi:hypothetical protein
MITRPDWLAADDDDLPARDDGSSQWQLLAFKIKETAAVFQIKTFIKFRILFNWEWRIVFTYVSFNLIWMQNQHSDLQQIESKGC